MAHNRRAVIKIPPLISPSLNHAEIERLARAISVTTVTREHSSDTVPQIEAGPGR